jgi:hypothetical protein
MHTIERLERLKEVAERAGYTVRQEWLGGVAGGACQFAGRKWIFLDLSLSVIEQLEQMADALHGDPAVAALSVPASLYNQVPHNQVPRRRAA